MHVRVVDYQPEWPAAYEAEARRLRAVFGKQLAAIHHIGSTAVPGLCAKPILDILPVIRDIECAEAFRAALEAMGYEWMGEFGIPGRRYLRKGGENRTHQLHIFAAVNYREVERHLAVRDYLRAHPAQAAEYGTLKRRLAAQFPEDIESYCDGKDAFVRALECDALFWYHENAASTPEI